MKQPKSKRERYMHKKQMRKAPCIAKSIYYSFIQNVSGRSFDIYLYLFGTILLQGVSSKFRNRYLFWQFKKNIDLRVLLAPQACLVPAQLQLLSATFDRSKNAFEPGQSRGKTWWNSTLRKSFKITPLDHQGALTQKDKHSHNRCIRVNAPFFSYR